MTKGRPAGSQNKDKPFREAIRMEAAAAENGLECIAEKGSLRWIARRLLERAGVETQAAKEVGDRLDGKPAQESTVILDDKREAADWTRSELVAFLNDQAQSGNGVVEADGRGGKSDRVH